MCEKRKGTFPYFNEEHTVLSKINHLSQYKLAFILSN